MMYGFGDDQNPYTESVDLLEDLVIEFITEIVSRQIKFLVIIFKSQVKKEYIYLPIFQTITCFRV